MTDVPFPSPKPGLVVHDADGAFNAETPPHLLDDPITPAGRLFVRNNGHWPEIALADPDDWELVIDGEVECPLRLTRRELKARFETVRLVTVLECAGNGRHMLEPPTDGVPWGLGAVGCLEFEGVRMADVLAAAGLRPTAVYLGHCSPDRNLKGTGDALSRGLPLAKGLAPETLVAFSMNGQDLPFAHGGPLRVVAPGFPGSAWQKWLSRLWVRDREHDGARMTGLDYRLPRRPVGPGETPDPADFAVIEDMPVRSLITTLNPAEPVRAGVPLRIGGWAYAGATAVTGVEVSVDGGATWRPARLSPPSSRWAWARFEADWTPPAPGPVTILARASDARGRIQPLTPDNWNPKGYCCNACHRVTVRVG